jgi:hypothetical protein
VVVVIFTNVLNSSEAFAELKNLSVFVTQCPIGVFQPDLESTSPHWSRNSPFRREGCVK